MRRIRRGLFVVAAAIFSLSLPTTIFPPPAGAAGRVVLTASPAVIDISGKAGSSTIVSFRLINNENSVLPIRLNAKRTSPRKGQSEELASSLSAHNWIVFSAPDFILQPKETKNVPITLNIPKGTAAGGHYADIVVTLLSHEDEKNIVAAQPELVAQMLVNVSGRTTERLNAYASEKTRIITSQQPAERKLVFTIKNTGNIHTLSQPELTVSRGGKILDRILSKPIITLPGEDKRVEFVLTKNTPTGIYTAQMRFTYGTAKQMLISPLMYILVLPLNPLFLLLLVAVVLITFFFLRIRDRVFTAVRIITKGQ